MKNLYLFLLTLFSFQLTAQHQLSIKVDIDESIRPSLKPEGRMFIFLNQKSKVEPYTQNWPMPGNYIFAQNLSEFSSGFDLDTPDKWMSNVDWDFKSVPSGVYYVQAFWVQNKDLATITAEGNIYSQKVKLDLTSNQEALLTLSTMIPPRSIVEHPLVKVVKIQSKELSEFLGKPMFVKASILLPHNYRKGNAYPIRYNISGNGGRYDRVNRLVGNKDFMTWWQSADAPPVINVFVDADGPFGDNYHLNSDNSGPYGTALIEELAPAIEKEFRGNADSKTRFVDGCSTGGWVSLGLQLYYPDFFNGVFSYSPDAIDFENYQLINIYKDKNAYVNEHGYLRPVMRDTNGEPMMSLKEFITYENVMGTSNTYLNSGGQFSAHSALYSPKGENGLPVPLFDPQTGVIDHGVAKHWEKYDFKKYTEKNWGTLGPKIQGKIYVWMGDMDNFYLNTGTRSFDAFMKITQNPTSDAVFEYTPMKGHCENYSNKRVLLQIKERLSDVNQ